MNMKDTDEKSVGVCRLVSMGLSESFAAMEYGLKPVYSRERYY